MSCHNNNRLELSFTFLSLNYCEHFVKTIFKAYTTAFTNFFLYFQNKIENITPAKQPLFGQSSHQINQNTPNSNNNSGSVRRSSRLFVSQQETIKSKENANKTPNPSKVSRNNIKSPSKKSSKSSRPNTRQMANPNAASSENLQPVDKNEKNRMMDFEESENRPPSMDDSVFISQVKGKFKWATLKKWVFLASLTSFLSFYFAR